MWGRPEGNLEGRAETGSQEQVRKPRALGGPESALRSEKLRPDGLKGPSILGL